AALDQAREPDPGHVAGDALEHGDVVAVEADEVAAEQEAAPGNPQGGPGPDHDPGAQRPLEPAVHGQRAVLGRPGRAPAAGPPVAVQLRVAHQRQGPGGRPGQVAGGVATGLLQVGHGVVDGVDHDHGDVVG